MLAAAVCPEPRYPSRQAISAPPPVSAAAAPAPTTIARRRLIERAGGRGGGGSWPMVVAIARWIASSCGAPALPRHDARSSV